MNGTMHQAVVLLLLLALAPRAHAQAAPNDPLYAPRQWNLPMINAPATWARLGASAAGKKIVVAVLDTGIVRGHPDLPEARLLPGHDFVSDPARAQDGDGRDADPQDTRRAPALQHGLHVAGMIVAARGNAVGIAGLCEVCQILPVRVVGEGEGDPRDLVDGLRWAAGLPVDGMPRNATPAQVINLSLTRPGLSQEIQQAIDDVVASGAIVVAAAGNQGADASGFSPGGLRGVITVGAATRQYQRAGYSNHGPRVDLLAPGGEPRAAEGERSLDLWSLQMRDGVADYAGLSGTSQAAPQVSAAAALVLTQVALQQEPMAQLLRRSADARFSCDRLPEQGCGAGLLDLDRALALAQDWARCGCAASQACEEGRCVAVSSPHEAPAFGCAVAAGRGGSHGGAGVLMILLLGWLQRIAVSAVHRRRKTKVL